MSPLPLWENCAAADRTARSGFGRPTGGLCKQGPAAQGGGYPELRLVPPGEGAGSGKPQQVGDLRHGARGVRQVALGQIQPGLIDERGKGDAIPLQAAVHRAPVDAEVAPRVGDVVMLARTGTAVVATRRERLPSMLIGLHGSLTDQELAIPALVATGPALG